jgi:Tol biopolymer transport system component
VVAVLLVVAAYLVFGPDGSDELVTLPEDELLLGVDDDDGQHHLIAVNVDTGGSRIVSTGDIYLPTIAHDRRHVAVMLGEAANRPTLAGVDGSDQQPLVSEDSSECQYSRRPAQSTDGRWAMVCQDDTGGTEGLFVVGQDGVPNELPVSPNVTGAPTWDDDGEVVFVVKEGGEHTSLWQVSGDGGVPVPLEDVDADSASAPDWSPAGLLYLGTDEAGETDVFLHDEGGEDRRLTSDGEIEAASWSPDGRRMAFIAPDDADSLSLWVKDVFENSKRREVQIDGEPGPPAWSSR